MAKKMKVSSKAKNCLGSDCTYSPSLYIDFDDLAEVKGLAVGDTVRIMIRGTVKSVEQREAYEGDGVRASVSVKDFESEIVSNETDFDKLLEDDDE